MSPPITSNHHPLLPLLATSAFPPFIYFHHPSHSTTTSLPHLSLPHITVDASTTINSRGLYTAILRAAKQLGPDAGNAEVKDVVRWDGFVRGLKRTMDDRKKSWSKGKGKERVVGVVPHTIDVDLNGNINMGVDPLQPHASTSAVSAAAFSSHASVESEAGLVLIIQHAEALNKVMGNGWGVITRLPEMLQPHLTLTIVLTSQQPWDLVRPATSDAIEPIHIMLRKENKVEIIQRLLDPSSSSHPKPVNHPLYPHFLLILHTTFAHLISHSVVEELERLGDVLWDVWSDGVDLMEFEGGPVVDGHINGENRTQDSIFEDPRQTITRSLITHLTRQSTYAFSAAAEILLTRQVSSEWFREHYIPSRVRARQLAKESRGQDVGAFMALNPNANANANHILTEKENETSGIPNPFLTSSAAAAITRPSIPKPKPSRIPYYAKYLVLAAYFASFNPRTSDLRMFGRGPLAEPWKGKKKGGGMRKVALSRNVVGRVGKVPQRLLGPKSFPLERLLAIFQSLLAEHGFADHHPEDELPSARTSAFRSFADTTEEEREAATRRDTERMISWEEEVEELSRSVGIWGMIPELESLNLIAITSPRDRLDRILLRSETPKDFVQSYASQLGIKDMNRYLADAE